METLRGRDRAGLHTGYQGAFIQPASPDISAGTDIETAIEEQT